MASQRGLARCAGLVVLALFVAACTDDGGGSASNSSPPGSETSSSTTTAGQHGEAVEVFGLDSVLTEAEVRPGVWIVIGMRSGGDGSLADLVVAGAVGGPEAWTIRLWQRLEVNPGGCAPLDPADALVPESSVLMAQCLVGGSDGATRLVAAGIGPDDEFPELLLNLNCGASEVAVEGESLLVTRRAPRSEPDAEEVSFELRWDGDRIDLVDVAQRQAWNAGCTNTTGTMSDTPFGPD